MIWDVPKIWEDGDVWILGGGPSVTKQFSIPETMVQNVVSGKLPPSVYSPYMSFLHDKHVIGINVSYLIGDWIDMVFFGDPSFFLSHQVELAKFKGLKVSCAAITNKHKWVKYLPVDKKHRKGISPLASCVSWNGNSGAAAISLAVNTGAKRIFLLGFDMKLDESRKQHWHDLYGRLEKIRTSKNRRGRPYTIPFDRHLTGFPFIAQDAKKRGVEIINVSPDSAIQCFKKATLKDIMNECN